MSINRQVDALTKLVLKHGDLLAQISKQLTQASNERKAIMSKLDEVNAKIASLGTALDAIDTATKDAAAAIKALVDAKGDPTLSAAVDAALAGLDVATSRANAEHDALEAVAASATA